MAGPTDVKVEGSQDESTWEDDSRALDRFDQYPWPGSYCTGTVARKLLNSKVWDTKDPRFIDRKSKYVSSKALHLFSMSMLIKICQKG